MQLIYSDSNPLIVFNLKNILTNEGIQCHIRNDCLSSTAGEVPPTEVWPELWVERERDYEKAKSLLDKALQGDAEATSWFCYKCSETNEPAFEVCWKCGNERD